MIYLPDNLEIDDIAIALKNIDMQIQLLQHEVNDCKQQIAIRDETIAAASYVFQQLDNLKQKGGI